MTSKNEIAEIDVEHLRSWIDREDVAVDVISIDLVRKFLATFDIAADMPLPGDAAPLLIQYCLAQPAALTQALGTDGHPDKGGFLPPVPLPRRMWAGSALTFHGELFVSEPIRRVSRIADVALKQGRSGPLCFVTVLHRYDVHGELRIEESQTIVYRAAQEASAPADNTSRRVNAVQPGLTVPVGTHSRPLSFSTALLFRYSALTFNGHRIHYDLPYATQVEHYPNLVVHGPLQATLLLNFARGLRARTPKRFAFQAVSPLFVNDNVSMNAEGDGEIVKLWISGDAAVAMNAQASW